MNDPIPTRVSLQFGSNFSNLTCMRSKTFNCTIGSNLLFMVHCAKSLLIEWSEPWLITYIVNNLGFFFLRKRPIISLDRSRTGWAWVPQKFWKTHYSYRKFLFFFHRWPPKGFFFYSPKDFWFRNWVWSLDTKPCFYWAPSQRTGISWESLRSGNCNVWLVA